MPEHAGAGRLALVDRVRAVRARTGFVLDFDGSLAPIQDDPAAVRPVPGAVDALRALSHVAAFVAVVSGRPISFLEGVLDVPGLVLAGVYGLELRVPGGATVVDPAAQAFADAVDRAATAATQRLPGLLVERKGTLAVTIHWRLAPDRESEAMASGVEIAEAHGLQVVAGRRSLELRPPVAVDKGTTVESLVTERPGPLGALVVVGDDRGDLACFDASDRLTRAGAVDQAFRVAVASSEAPADLLERADVVLESPVAVVDLLGELASAG